MRTRCVDYSLSPDVVRDSHGAQVMEKLLKMDSQGFVRWIDFERVSASSPSRTG